MPYLPYQKRMLEERDQLSARLTKLVNFIDDSPEFLKLNEMEQGRLREQRRFMTGYLETLKARIDVWM